MGRYNYSLLVFFVVAALLVTPSLALVLGRKSQSSHVLTSETEGQQERGEAERERQRERQERREHEHDHHGHDQHEHEHEHEREREREISLDLGEPREILSNDGGAMRVWSEDVEAIGNAAIGVAELELKENGLLLPAYVDVPKIGYVTRGCGYFGAVFPGVRGSIAAQPYVRQVKKGDVVAIPEGTIQWWYNDGNEALRVLFAADTSVGVRQGRAHQFALVGGQQRHFGSLLHGFSRDALGAAWGVDKETIRSLLESQSEVSIIRTQRTLRFPRARGEEEEMRERGRHRRREEEEEEEEQRRRRRRDENGGVMRGGRHGHGGGGGGSAPYFREIHYSGSGNQPDFFVEKGGVLDMIDFQKFPALLHVGFSIARISLEKNALFAPSYIPNAHQLIYVTRGSGRIQVSSGDGRNVFDEEVREGSFIVIPQFFPSIKIAGNEGLEWVDLLTSHRPMISFLAGRNSVYYNIPKAVLASAFNVEQGTLKQLGRDELIIFPPQSSKFTTRGSGGARGRGERETSEEEEEERHRRRRSGEDEEERERSEEEEEERHRRRRSGDDDEEEEHHHHHHHHRGADEDESYWLEQALASVL